MENNFNLENPYLGPASFDESQSNRFFGRGDEIRELTSLVIARRAVLLYAQSGAGKTSLIKAGVIPELKRREEFGTLPLARVTGAGESSGSNPYVASALGYLLKGANVAGQTLGEGVGRLLDGGDNPVPHLLIFDQFEEIFTYHPELSARRMEFFEQLRQCLAAFPQLTLLIAMREDYIAGLDAYAGYLPDRMRTRMRLERLPYRSAVAAVRGPAAQAGKPFAKGVAEQLVDNLRRVQTGAAVPGAEADGPPPLGEYVEPVQLQIVCWQLWSKLPEHATSIAAGEVNQYANVDDALTKFYTGALGAACKAGAVNERTLRQWFGHELITPARTRGLVYRGAIDTAGLPNAAVDSLQNSYLIRGDMRGGGMWYELTHDRLVEPILDSNQNWRAAYRNPVADAFERWDGSGRSSGKLLNGNQLIEARAYAAGNPGELTADEKAFVETSATEAARVRKRNWILAGTGLAVLLGFAGLSAAAWSARSEALAQRAEALSQRQIAVDAKGVAEIERGKANTKEGEAKEAQGRSEKALAQNDIDTARGLVREARTDEALPYLARALRLDKDSLFGRAWIYDLLRDTFWFRGRVFDVVGNVVSVAFSQDGRRLAVGSKANAVAVYDTRTGRKVGGGEEYYPGSAVALSRDGNRLLTASDAGRQRGVFLFDLRPGAGEGVQISESATRSAVFSPDGKSILTASSTSVELLDPTNGKSLARYPPQGAQRGARSATYSANGEKILIVLEKQGAEIWDVKTLRLLRTVAVGEEVASAAISPDGLRVATASSDGVEIWSVTGGEPARPLIPASSINGSATRIHSLSFSPDGARLITSSGTTIAILSEGGNARVWDVTTGQQVGQTLLHTAGVDVFSAVFSPDGRSVVTGGQDGTRIWEAPAADPPGAGVPVSSISETDDEDRNFVSVSRDGRRIATSVEDGSQVWDAFTGKGVPRGRLKTGGDRSWPLFSPDGRRIVTVGSSVVAWDSETLEPLRPAFDYPGKAPLITAQFSADSQRLLARSDKQVWVWDASTGKLAGPALTGATFDSATLSPDGLRVVTASDSSASEPDVRVWDVVSGRSRKLPDAQFAEFAPDGRSLVVGTVQGLRVLDLATLHPVPKSRLAGTTPSAVARFSPNGLFVAIIPNYHFAQVLDAVTAQSVGQQLRQEKETTFVTFSPDSSLVATGHEGEVQIWDLRTGRPVGRRLRHDLTLPVKFSPDGRRVMVCTKQMLSERSRDRKLSLRILDLFPPSSPAATNTLADLGEVVGGARIGDLGAPVAFTREEKLARMRQLVAQSSQADPVIAGLIRRFAGVLNRSPR